MHDKTFSINGSMCVTHFLIFFLKTIFEKHLSISLTNTTTDIVPVKKQKQNKIGIIKCL